MCEIAKKKVDYLGEGSYNVFMVINREQEMDRMCLTELFDRCQELGLVDDFPGFVALVDEHYPECFIVEKHEYMSVSAFYVCVLDAEQVFDVFDSVRVKTDFLEML